MLRRVVVSVIAVLALTLGVGTSAFAANPPGTGQPSQSCGSAGAESEPAGFSTQGFSNAEARYAGTPGTPSANNGSSTAVSQYDVACFQVTSSGH